MKKYINLLLIPIIIVTLKQGTVKDGYTKEFNGEYYRFYNYSHGCGSVVIYKKRPSQLKKHDNLYNNKIIEFNCDSVISVEKK